MLRDQLRPGVLVHEGRVRVIAFFAENLFPICCGINFDLGVEFGVDYKAVSLIPKLAGWGEGCLEIYGDVDWFEAGTVSLDGIRLDGFKVRCELGDCTFAEFVTFLSPENAGMYGYEGVFTPSIGEFEYVKLGFCGPGCCGGKYGLEATVYFHDPAYVIRPRILPPRPRPPLPRPPGEPSPRPIPWPPLPPWPWPALPDTFLAISRVEVMTSVPLSTDFTAYLGLSWGWFLIIAGPPHADMGDDPHPHPGLDPVVLALGVSSRGASGASEAPSLSLPRGC